MKPTIIPAIFRAKDEMSAKLQAMQKATEGFSSKLNAAGKTAFAVGRNSAIAGAFIAAPLVVAAKAAVDFEEKMTDVAKTTGMSGKPLQQFGDEILAMSTKTRTSINDLASIAEIGGQLGIAQKDMIAFTESANQFNIALGADFSGGVEEAVSTVGKIKTLFAETRGLNIADAITRTGSAINELGAVGAGTSANISDFTLRMGALPDSLKMSAQNTLALGTYLEELGIDAQIGAGGMSNLLLVAGREIGGFAKQMGISTAEAKELLKQDPSKFATRFSETFKGMAPDKMANALHNLKLGSQETIKVIGALSSDQKNQMTGLTRYAELQNVANKAFAENNSLKSEAAKKEATAAAQMAKLKNNMQALAITVGNALLPVINDLVTAIMPYIDSAAQWIRDNRKLTGTIVKVAAGAAALAFAISGISFAYGIYQKAAVIAKTAQLALNAAQLLSPMGLIAGAAIAAGVGIAAIASQTWKLSSAQDVANEVNERALEKTLDQRVEMTLLFTQLRKTKVGTDQYREALDKIEQMSPGLVEKYKLQEGGLRRIAAAERDLTAQIMARAKAEAEQEMLKESVRESMRLQQEGPSTMQQVLGAITGTGATGMWINDIAEQENRSKILSDQIASRELKAANPEAAKAASQKLDINIQGLPDGSSATMNGKTVSTKSSGMLPKLATNL